MFAILPGQYVATVAANQLPKLSELSQREVFINEMGHPVVCEVCEQTLSTDTTLTDGNGATPLHYAAAWASVSTNQHLLHVRSRVHFRTQYFCMRVTEILGIVPPHYHKTHTDKQDITEF